MEGYSYLTFDQRREIEALYSDGERAVDIAAKIGRSVAAIYEELKRGTRESLTKTSVLFTAPILHRRQHLKTLGAGAKDAPQISNERKAIQYENEEDRKSRRIANDRICDRRNDKRKHLY